MANKTEKPTHKRLRDSAKKGQSFSSQDTIISCLVLAGIGYLTSYSSLLELMDAYQQLVKGGFEQNIQSYAVSMLWLGLKILLPVIALCVFASALPSLLISGFVIASEALKLNFSALNPINGFKKLFSLRTVKNAVKTLLYLAAFVVTAVVLWHQHKAQLFSQLHGDPLSTARVWLHLLRQMALIYLACVAVILPLDALAEYFLFMKDMKMEKEEVKRERKEQDGNPEVKSRRREFHLEILSAQARSDIENSRVIIANPTHIAMGIYFKPELFPAPVVSVKETNQQALAVRSYAEKIGIPVVTDIKLARSLFASHRRYDLINMQQIDEVLRLLVWLEQVECAGLDAYAQRPQEPESPPTESDNG